jgi:hypothetical protein
MRNDEPAELADDPFWITGKALDRHFELEAALLEFTRLFDHKGDDRAMVIVDGAFLDTLLEHILIAFLVNDEKEVGELLRYDQPLGTYGVADVVPVTHAEGFADRLHDVLAAGHEPGLLADAQQVSGRDVLAPDVPRLRLARLLVDQLADAAGQVAETQLRLPRGVEVLAMNAERAPTTMLFDRAALDGILDAARDEPGGLLCLKVVLRVDDGLDHILGITLRDRIADRDDQNAFASEVSADGEAVARTTTSQPRRVVDHDHVVVLEDPALQKLFQIATVERLGTRDALKFNVGDPNHAQLLLGMPVVDSLLVTNRGVLHVRAGTKQVDVTLGVAARGVTPEELPQRSSADVAAGSHIRVCEA